jgi:AcrR family transcriptional regulator
MERLDCLYAELDQVLPRLRGSTTDRLRSMFALFFAFETRHVQLILAHVSIAFDWTLPAGATPFGRNARIRELICECLEKGVADGDVDPEADLREVVELLVAAYVWTYRMAAWTAADAEAMTAAMDRQIGLIAEGFRPRSNL